MDQHQFGFDFSILLILSHEQSNFRIFFIHGLDKDFKLFCDLNKLFFYHEFNLLA